MGSAGVGVETFDALFLGALELEQKPPAQAALAARVRFLLFTIIERIGGRSKNIGGSGAAVLRKKDEKGRRTVKRENGKDKFCPSRL
jgi:hypothetical protein